jgi:RIC1
MSNPYRLKNFELPVGFLNLGPAVQLSSVVWLLKHFPQEMLVVVVGCAKKTEVRVWHKIRGRAYCFSVKIAFFNREL